MNFLNDFNNKKAFKIDLIYSIFIIGLMGLFVLANYFAGFNLALYAIAVLISASIVFFYPHAGFYAIIFLTFIFERFFTLVPIILGRNEYKIYPIDVLLIAVILGILFQFLIGKIKFKFKKIDIAIIVFILMSTVYFFLSVFVFKGNISLAFSSSKNYAFYALLYFVAATLINNKERLKELFSVIISGAIGILWFVFYGIVVKHGLWSDFTPLSTDGIRTLAFTHGFYLSMVLIISLVYMAYRSDKLSKLMLILAPFWIIGIVGSMMRHLWISLFVAAMFLVIKFTRDQRARLRVYAKRYSLAIFLIFIVLFYGAVMFPRSKSYESLIGGVEMVQNRVTSISNTSEDESIIWRGAVWHQAADQYLKKPLTGIGYGKFVSVEIGKYHDFVEVRNIHNSFLVVLVQMGIVGIVSIFVLILGIGLKMNRFKADDEFLQIVVCSSLAILLMQTVAFMFQPYLEANLLSIFFWINLGVLRTLYGWKKEEHDQYMIQGE